MIRELVMAGICVVAAIVLAWVMDHPRKELGSGLALAAFAVMVAVAYVKNRNRAKRPTKKLVQHNREAEGE